MEKKEKIELIEEVLDIYFPSSYREFLIQQGIAKIAGYTILGIPEETERPEEIKSEEVRLDLAQIAESESCPVCGNRKYKGKITCYPCYNQYSSDTGRQIPLSAWMKDKLSSPKKEEIKPLKRDLSVVEATQFLLRKRPDLTGKKMIPICFKEDLNTGKQMALCMNLSENPKDDAPLVVILDINNQQAEPAKHSPKLFVEWLAHLKGLVKRHRHFKVARQRIRNRKNEIRHWMLKKEIEQKFGQKCPLCRIREREKPLVCQQCHNEWHDSAKDKSDFVEWVQKKIEEKGLNLPKSSHKGGKNVKHIHPRAQDWHSRIFRVADYVVGLTAFRYSYQFGCLEVDAFWFGDLAGYVKGQAIRNLVIAVLSEANSLTGSLALAFTRDIRENKKTGKIIKRGWRREAEKKNGRVSCPVPQELVDFTLQHQISLSQSHNGVITHQEGLDIFWAALGWPEHLQAKVDELEEKGYLTKQALANVIYSGIWSLQEAVWLFENAPRPEAILLGSDIPEDCLYYTESLHWGRSVYLANLLKIKVSADLADGLSVEEREESDCELEPQGEFWLLKSSKDFEFPWMIKGSEQVLVEANEPVLILSVPCQTTQEANDLGFIKEGFKTLKNAKSPAKVRCLIVSFEFSDLKYGMKIAEFMKDNSMRMAEKGIYLLFSPYRLDLLNDEAESRMASARRKRKFPSRKTPLRLQLIEISEERWQKPDLLYSVEDAKSAAYWIEKKIDQRLGRIRFRVNCSCIERIAAQDAGAKLIATVDGQDSKDILVAMTSESGVTFPFVLPEEMPEFAKKTNAKIRKVMKTMKGGLVVLTMFEKSEFSETTEPSVATAEIHSVDSGFQFPVKPDDVDFSSYAVNRPEEIARTHQQIQHALRNGEPLAVSYLRHEVFVEAIREYLFYNASYEVETTYEERRIAFFTERVKHEKKTETRNPAETVGLRIVYNDGTEGQPFPLFCLTKRSKPEGLYQMKVGSISMRHTALDLVTDGYLIQNIMVSKRKLSSADQEDYAFRQTWHFLANFVDLVQHKKVKDATREIRFKYLWGVLGLKDKKSKGCELHIFQTGLVPATVGIYRAVVKFLQERRGELVVAPRLIGKKAGVASKDEEETVDAAYLKAAEWF